MDFPPQKARLNEPLMASPLLPAKEVKWAMRLFHSSTYFTTCKRIAGADATVNIRLHVTPVSRLYRASANA
jgi:hypothetical protein